MALFGFLSDDRLLHVLPFVRLIWLIFRPPSSKNRNEHSPRNVPNIYEIGDVVRAFFFGLLSFFASSTLRRNEGFAAVEIIGRARFAGHVNYPLTVFPGVRYTRSIGELGAQVGALLEGEGTRKVRRRAL